ncbi:MAG: FAD-dependent oxidoreductase, partial [Aeromicrobium sp.]
MSHQTVFERRAPEPSAVAHALGASQQTVFWLDGLDAASHEPLRGGHRADLTVVGGGYTGLWTAVLAKRRDPSRRVVLLESQEIGWAASGRNGGFAEASLTHGEQNGRSRWPDEYDTLERLGRENLAGLERDVRDLGLDAELERTGVLSVAYEPHQVRWLEEMDEGTWLDEDAVKAEINSPIVRAGRWQTGETVLVHPGKLAKELARAAVELGVEVHEYSAVTGIESGGRGAVRVHTTQGHVVSDRVALCTNVFRPLLRRARLMTVPVYDYVLMTEPLSTEQMGSIGWRHRQGLADLANQFHYSRLTADDRILYGGYDAIYHSGRQVRSEYEDRPASYETLASHFLTTFPQLEGVRF